MATAAQPVPATPKVSLPAPGQHIVIHGMDWEGYVAIADALPDGSRVHTAYDGWNLQLMTTSQEHERIARLLEQLITQICLATSTDCVPGGSTTFRREDLERGLEPDECFWIANYQTMLAVDRWEGGAHPPPDLAIEVDITSQSLPKRPIYAALGVPELWHFDGDRISSLILAENEYAQSPRSLAFPAFDVANLLPFVAMLETQSNTAIIRAFQAWLTENPWEVDESKTRSE